MNPSMMIRDCGSAKLPKSRHAKTIRLVTKLTARQLAKNPRLWGVDKNEALMWVFRAVADACPMGRDAVCKVIYKALNRLKDESEKNRVRLVPVTVRNAEEDALSAGKDRERAMQAAYREFHEDLILISQHGSCRLIDRAAVHWTYAKLTKEEKRTCALYLLARYSLKRAAARIGMSENTFRRQRWLPMCDHFRELWKQVDWDKLAEEISSNPYVFAGSSGGCSFGE